MTEQEREELIEKMARHIAVSEDTTPDPNSEWCDENWHCWIPEARAALAVAEPVIREQADIALREENARLREEVESLKSEESCNDVLLEYAQAETQRLREENARLREVLRPFADVADRWIGQQNREVLVMLEDCFASAAAIRETSK